ncbi:hypothetical protein [Lysobacter humi (ex Lee et al. 2017)]
MSRITRLFHLVLAALVFGAIAMPATAAPLGAEWQPVDAARLDRLRGGFVAPSGFTVSFGIERVVSVNGDVVTSTRLHVPDLARLTAEQAQALASLRDTQVVQIGAGTAISGGTAGLVIQNAVDGQAISARTSLDVSLNTLQLYRDTQLNTAIGNAVVGPGAGL